MTPQIIGNQKVGGPTALTNKKIELLQILATEVSQCKKCEQLAPTRTQTVFGEGNVNTKLVFVGEAPGENEDKQGRPFVGKAGKKLDSVLERFNIQREDVYICNILKCRPPNNRVPTPQEACNCDPFLKFQLKVINPKFIVCLGATATRYLLKMDAPIGQLRGKWYLYKDERVDAAVLCTYHPSYLCRNPSAEDEVVKDLQLLIERL